MSAPTSLEVIGTIVFALAVLHTFSVKQFQILAGRFPEGSVGENFFHLLGEIEIVFGLWAGLLVVLAACLTGFEEAVLHIEGLDFTEPAFVFVILTVAATRPVMDLATSLVGFLARLLPLPRALSFYLVALVAGPLLGSLITEPAAMTVTALLLRRIFFERDLSDRFKYVTLAVLFVNVSVGGVLTHFAAPPVLMVASAWKWTTPFVFAQFGWNAILVVLTNAALAGLLLRKELHFAVAKPKPGRAPFWLTAAHLGFLALIVLTSHHVTFFVGCFLFFLGVVTVTREYQDELQLKEGLLVGFFLAGLVVLGVYQSWWLGPLIPRFQPLGLFSGAALLTALLDNAALTYLAAQVPSLGEAARYAVVAGAVAGGGLTVIANAPNPAGFSILSPTFGKNGVSPFTLLLYATPPTLVAALYLWLL